jgi:putative DNA primase/helicase
VSSLADGRKARQAEELAEIRAALRNVAGPLTEQLLGEKPSSRKGDEWSWGRRGAMKVKVRGPKAGLWHDHSAGKGDDMLGMIQHIRGGSFPDAVAEARRYLGMPEPDFARPIAADERRRIEEKIHADADRRAAEAEEEALRQAETQERQAKRARRSWHVAQPAPDDHPYAVAKGLKPVGLRVDPGGNLLCPMRDMKGKVWGLQRIAPDGGTAWREAGWSGHGNKRFSRGARKDGTFMLIGRVFDDRPVAFAEGWATGRSVHVCTGLPVVVCWDVSNKASVMRLWRSGGPDRLLIDAADNDHAKERNAGAEMAARLAAEIGAIPVLPPFTAGEEGKDWNDYHRTKGAPAVWDVFNRTLTRQS